MPPKRKRGPAVKETVRIDPNKHAEKLKEIELSHQKQLEDELAAAEEAEELLDEEEMGSEEEEYEMSLSEMEAPTEIGRIDLSFPETTDEFSDSAQCYPPSYYTLSSKERLLLLYAENFRKQFIVNYPQRRALVLALPNECNVQKLVCTTIRPTAFLHIPLIGNVEGCASFVADYIIYEPLADIMKFPTRLISPDTLLRRRRGNSFEMATLLCSMLIGAGFPAMVVSGVARSETILNDQRNVEYPHNIAEIKTEENDENVEKTGQKYKLRPIPDLESHLEENMTEMLRIKEEEEQRQRDEIRRLEQEELDLRAVDRYHFRRTHAWVVIIDNAPWSIQPRKTFINEDGDVVIKPQTARFIETSTGVECETNCKQYILVDSVWNNSNYYVNKQTYQRVSDIRWDLRNLNDWEHLLLGEPPEMRTYTAGSDENIIVSNVERAVNEEKHLDTIRSWVLKLHIGQKEFEERFPKMGKTIQYKRAIQERFSPYSQRDGKVMQLTIYSDDEYNEPDTRWEYFENRADLLKQLKHNYETGQTEESFHPGRYDSLKFIETSDDPSKPKCMHFYPAPRLDSLKYLEVHLDRIVLHYSNRRDRCIYQMFEFKSAGSLMTIVEKFSRDTSGRIPAMHDIAVRTILLQQRKIELKFQYSKGALTASTLDFVKPPKPDYGKELQFDPSYAKTYKANVADPDLTPLELYELLLSQLEQEKKLKKQFERILEDINSILDIRKQEMSHPLLKFRLFDPLRNGTARAIRLKKNADYEEFKREMSTKPADFLAPYLVLYKGAELTYEQSWAAYNACLTDLKTRFVGLLNELQRQYEDYTAEAKSLKRFLNKFEDQFDNYDYNRLVQDAKDIELNKRMVQQRLTLTHEESQKKYEVVKASLMKDPRLNLRKSNKPSHSESVS